VILHESVKEDLVLVTQRGEESVFKDDRGLLLVSLCLWRMRAPWQDRVTYLEELVPCPQTLFLETVHIVR
jgi:hypothetical protein